MLCQKCYKYPGKPYKVYCGKQLRGKSKYNVIPTQSLDKFDGDQVIIELKKAL